MNKDLTQGTQSQTALFCHFLTNRRFWASSIKHAGAAFAIIMATTTIQSYAADEYYRWTDEAGIVHYGSRPPEGVKAEIVKTYNNPSAKSSSPAKSSNSSSYKDPSADAQKAGLKKQRAEECAAERKRLQTLQQSGTRIRMTQPDGSSKYLSPEEVMKEINTSKDFLSGACK